MENGVSQVISLHEYRCATLEPVDRVASPLQVTWMQVPECGRGLIACTDIEPGMIVDIAPAIPVVEEECTAVLRQYVFMCRREDGPDRYEGPFEHALVFGPMSLCNHSDEPNAEVCFVQDGDRGFEARLIARRPVLCGEEVTIRYTDHTWYKDAGRF